MMRWCFEMHNCFCLYRALTWIELGSLFPLISLSGITMGGEVAEEEQRDSFIYPLVFIFLASVNGRSWAVPSR